MTATTPKIKVMATENLILSCEATFYEVDGSPKDEDTLWKTCKWRRERDEAICKITAKDKLTWDIEECDQSLGEVIIIGGNRKKCEIEIHDVKLDHKGNWTCFMEKCRHPTREGCEHEHSAGCSGNSTVYVSVSNSF